MKILLLLFIPLFLVSCFQEEEKIYTVNPDGSGKVVFKVTLTLDVSPNKGSEEIQEIEARGKVATILEESKGIAAWSGISHKFNNDQELEFEGTAYFNDLNKVELNVGSQNLNSIKPILTKENGLVTIHYLIMEKGGIAAKPKKNKIKWGDMTKRQQKTTLNGARQRLTLLKAFCMGNPDWTSKTTINLPAIADNVKGFKKLSGSSLALTQSGENLIEVFDKVLADELVLQTLADGYEMKSLEIPEEVILKSFNLSQNPTATFSASSPPAFDYKKELLAAQKSTPSMLKKLGLTNTSPITKGTKFKSLRLAELNITSPLPHHDTDLMNGQAGTRFYFIGELPGSVISIEKGKLYTFTLSDGQDLLASDAKAQKQFATKIFSSTTKPINSSSFKLNENKTKLGFEIRSAQTPNIGTTSIKIASR